MSNIMNEEYLNLFSVPIRTTELELNIDSLIEFCYIMSRKNEKGVKVSNDGGWQSDNIIDETHPEFVKLKTEIEKSANIYHRDIQFKKTQHQKIINIWVNINQKGHSNVFHSHPSAILTGAFYLTKTRHTPIVFRHSYDCDHMYPHKWYPLVIEEWNETNRTDWLITPEPNTLLIFPPWVKHKVLVNEEDIDRISISFNTEVIEN